MDNAGDLLYFNGINGATGEYETPPLPLDTLAKIAKGETIDAKDLQDLNQKQQAKTEGHWGVKEGVDANNLAQTGWGVVFAFADKDKTSAIQEALRPLLDYRRSQAGERYKEYVGASAYRPNESKNDFLTRHGAGPGPADPDKVPYYLLIVGDPESIPYRVQSQLDVQYAVGRIHFDTVDEYAAYARAVVQAEQQKAFLARNATFFGVANPDDRATNLSAEQLIKPLAAKLPEGAEAPPGWSLSTIAPADAKKAKLASLLGGGADSPALLFTASHGMGFPNGDARQLRHQGALLCQDWPGPQQWRKPVPEEHYLSADDVSGSANLLGLMAFFFACYGAGTPKLDEFAHKTGQRAQIAPNAFLAGLPRRLLTRGALAVVGHVERAWGTSFIWDRAGTQVEVFRSSLAGVMKGNRIGYAFEYFNERYAEISSDLNTQLEELSFGAEIENSKLVGLWTANNDARGYMIIGDPAARLPVVEAGATAVERPGLAAVVNVAKPAGSSAATASTASVVQPAAPAPGASFSAEGVDYGLGDSLKQVQASVQELIQRLTQTLKQMMDDVTSLEVRTYVSGDLAGVKYDLGAREFTNAKLRAMTRVSLDGDTLNVVPERSGKLDGDLWQAHLAMVQQAQVNRAEMLKTAAALLGSLKSL